MIHVPAPSYVYFPGYRFSVSHLFSEKGLKLPTIAVYYIALKDLLVYVFSLTSDPWIPELV